MAKSSRNEGYQESVLKLVINGKQAQTSLKDIQETYYKLNAEIKQMREADNPAEYRKKAEAIQKVKQAWDAARQGINGATQEVSSFKSQMQDLVNQTLSGVGIAGIAYGFVNGVKTLISKNAELSDSYGRVMKTTGLTEEAVDRLNDKFKKLDTRTTNADLLALAQVAGKLGVSAEKDVEGFVRAADKIGVALGEDLGGVEESINSLGKLVDIFKVKDQFGLEEGLLKVGSAINELGASGTANEKNMVDFANRMAGIAPAANISLSAVLGLAAVQDELGQSMEASSTAIGQFIVGMGEDIPKYAKIAKLSVGEFSKLLKTDANEALLSVLEGSKSVGGGVQALAANMKAIDVNGARGIAALGAMADNIELVRRRQLESSEAFDEGTSILNEFGVMNNTLAANLDKIGNKLDNVWQNSLLRDWFTKLTAAFLDNKSEAQKLVDNLANLKKENEQLESSINPLLTRYDELKTKGNLSKIEQDELKSVIQQLATLVPEAVTEWNRYGEAMDINRVKVMSMTIAQRELYALQNKATIESLKGSFEAQMIANKSFSQSANDIQNRLKNTKDGGFLSWFGIDKKGLWKSDIKEFTERSKLAMGVAYENAVKLRDMGVELTKPMLDVIDHFENKIDQKKPGNTVTADSTTTTTTTSTTTDKKAESERKKAEADRKRVQEEFEKLNQMTAEFGVDQLALQLSQHEQEIAQEHKKYEEKIKAWESFKSQKDVTDEQLLLADARIAFLEVEQDEAVAALKVKQAKETNDKIEELRNGLATRHATELEKERVRINKFYDDLEKDYAGNAVVIAQLREDREKDLADAKIREEERIRKETERIQKQTIDFESNKYANRIEKIKSAYALELAELEQKFANELQSTEAFEMAKAALKAKYGAQEKQVELQREEEIKGLKIAVATSLSDALFAISKQNRDAELAETLDRIEKQRASELSNKNLTEQQKKSINDRYDKMQRIEKQRAWKAEQQASIKQGLINTALAVTKALPNFIAAAAAGVAGLAQVAVIASQKPPIFEKGGFIPRGPSHRQGGLNVMTPDNQIIANIEGGEPIISRDTYANNREVVDALIYSGQRKNGASIGLNPVLMDSAVYAPGSTRSASTNQVIQVASPQMDTSELVRAIGQLVDDKISKIQVELPYTVLEDKQKKIVEIRNSVNA